MKANQTIAFLPVRAGSKSIPNKNKKLFCKKPLVNWNIEELIKVDGIDKIVVATDSNTITDILPKHKKVEVYSRDPENAKDQSSTESVMLEFIKKKKLSPEVTFILVQATSPFTKATHFEKGVELYSSNEFDSVLSCAEFKRFIWNIDGRALNYDPSSRPRRQDFDGNLIENGAFYINSVKNIVKYKNRLSGKIGVTKMPDYTSLELDEPLDWKLGELIMNELLIKKLNKENIKLFITDVDGVLTDSGMYYTENGDEIKKFSTYDGMGMELLRKANVKTAIITGENTELVRRRANKLKFDYLYMGINDKVAIANELCKKENITFDNIAYIGDDINDYELLKLVGIKACPKNAVQKIKDIPGIIQLNKEGGKGVVREFIEFLNFA